MSYGQSLLHKVFKPWRQLQLMEYATMEFRLARSFCGEYVPEYERWWKAYQERVERWKNAAQPKRFYMWLAWLLWNPIMCVIYRLRAWRHNRKLKKIKIGDFTEYMFPVIRAPMPSYDWAEKLLNVQPMTEPSGSIFYHRFHRIQDSVVLEATPEEVEAALKNLGLKRERHWTTKPWAWGMHRTTPAEDRMYWKCRMFGERYGRGSMSMNFANLYGPEGKYTATGRFKSSKPNISNHGGSSQRLGLR